MKLNVLVFQEDVWKVLAGVEGGLVGGCKHMKENREMGIEKQL